MTARAAPAGSIQDGYAPAEAHRPLAAYALLSSTFAARFAGALVVCPYCLAQWIAGAFTVGLVAAPRPTRLLAATWTAHALADAAQLAHGAAERRT